MSLATYVPYFKFIGLMASGAATGYIGMNTYPTIPILFLNQSTPSLLRQWELLYTLGSRIAPSLALTSSLSFFTLAYIRSTYSLPYLQYILAGCLTIGIVPYTLVVMMGTVNTLHGMRADAEGYEVTEGKEGVLVGKSEARELVDRWGLMNVGRFLLMGSGFAVALGLTIWGEGNDSLLL